MSSYPIKRLTGASIVAAIAFIGTLVMPQPCVAAVAAPAAFDISGDTEPDNSLWVDDLSLETVVSENGQIKADQTPWGHPITLSEVAYSHGIGVQGHSEMTINLKGIATQFESMVGVDEDTEKKGSVTFTVLVDGKPAYDSGPMVGGGAPKHVSVNLTGAKTLVLQVTPVNANDTGADNADWAGALIRLTPGTQIRPETLVLPVIGQRPVWHPESGLPAIHAPYAVGTRLGSTFAFAIPATGRAPLTFAASGLPSGLHIDSHSGIISGKVLSPLVARVQLSVSNSLGIAAQSMSIDSKSKKIALTPMMGWTASGMYGDTIDDAEVRSAADLLVSSGLAAHGYCYVNLGDAWQGTRDADGVLQANHRFPDMKGLADYVHSKGLKFGLYSASTTQTCAGYAGSEGHEAKDASNFASWGVDSLTYEWCPDSAGTNATQVEVQGDFTRMGDALAKSGRDIVFSTMFTVAKGGWQRPASLGSDPAKWAWLTGANSVEVEAGVYEDIKQVAMFADDRLQYADSFGPGYWMALGPLMVGRSGYPEIHYSRLRSSEQMIQMSLWSMYSSPLFVSADLEKLDPNSLNHDTTAILTNDEVVAVDQDPLGSRPNRIFSGYKQSTWTKSLTGGRSAVAFVNTGDNTRIGTVRWSDIKLSGDQPVRDLWKHQDMGQSNGFYSAMIPAHGVVMLVVGKDSGKVAQL